jgi:hypothetical protein
LPCCCRPGTLPARQPASIPLACFCATGLPLSPQPASTSTTSSSPSSM